MDNLTHSLVGAAIGKAGADRTTPLATATLVVAANVPDIDMVGFVRGEYFSLAFRRGITHGWPALLVLPFVVTGLMMAWDRWVRRRRDPDADPADPKWLLGLSAVGVVTHPSLDWLNIYGMRWSLPFDGTWTYGDSLFIIDPWIWLLLGGSVFWASAPGGRGMVGWAVLGVLTTLLLVVGVGGWPAALWMVGIVAILLARRATSTPARSGTGESPSSASLSSGHRRLVRTAAVLVLAYIGAMVAADRAARAHVIQAATAQGIMVVDVLVAPTRGVPHRSEVEVQTDDAFVPGIHDWFATPRVTLRPEDAVALRSVPDDLTDASAGAIIDEARAIPAVANYMVWARYPYVHVTSADDGWDVLFGDARYDSQPETGALAGVTVYVPRSAIPDP
ncbi:MAG: metal-dependent hydrolase [Gemmatimonadetes bacterium]|nr:metal-dependent hydrolase [Gemmatimonadota bacterium]